MFFIGIGLETLALMLGFPDEHANSFLEAWQEPFTGFELKWLEVEICRQAMRPSNVTDLLDRMKNRYPDIRDMHHSKFYRTVTSLEENGYLTSETEGRAKIVTTTPAGAKELGRITRYFFEIQMERIQSAVLEDLLKKITEHVGCLLGQDLLMLGPEYQAVNIIMRHCSRCNHVDKDNPIPFEEAIKHTVFLNYGASLHGRTEHSQIEDLTDLADWPYKAEAKGQLAIISLALSMFPDKAVNLLKEAKRVVGPAGKLVIYDLTSRDSKIISELMRDATMLINFSSASVDWKMPAELPKRETLMKYIEEAGLEIEQQFDDVINSIFIVK